MHKILKKQPTRAAEKKILSTFTIISKYLRMNLHKKTREKSFRLVFYPVPPIIIQ